MDALGHVRQADRFCKLADKQLGEVGSPHYPDSDTAAALATAHAQTAIALMTVRHSAFIDPAREED